MELHGDLLDLVPGLALADIKDGHGGAAEDIGAHQLVGGLDFAPAGHHGGAAGEVQVAAG